MADQIRGRSHRRHAPESFFAPLEPRQLLAVDTLEFDSFYDFTRDVPAQLSPADAAAFGYGLSVLVLGDVSGDDIEDFAVTAPGVRAEPLGHFQGPGPGRVFVFSGADLSLIRILRDDAASAVGFGASIANLGDIDGDAVSDVAVGSPNVDAAVNGVSERHGRVYIFSGASGNVIRTITGATPFAELGYSLSAAGDINLDGLAEFIVGAPGDGPDASAEGPGRVQVITASTGAVLYTFTGEADGDRFGHAVAGGADLVFITQGPADRLDILVGAPGFDLEGSEDQGRAYIYNGADGAFVSTLMLQASASRGTPAIVPGARTGSALAVSPGRWHVGSPGAGEVTDPAHANFGRGARSGVVNSFRWAFAGHLEPSASYHQLDLAEDARLGESIRVVPFNVDEGVYASQPGAPAQPLRALKAGSLDQQRVSFAGNASLDHTAGLAVAGFADGSVRVVHGAAANPGSTYTWSRSRGFGVLYERGNEAIALRGNTYAPLPVVGGMQVVALNDVGGIVARPTPLSGFSGPLSEFSVISSSSGVMTPLADLITSTEGPALGTLMQVARIFNNGDVLLYSENRSYRLHNGVLSFLGIGTAIDANDSGLTIATDLETSNTVVIWKPDGSEVRLGGYRAGGVSKSGRVTLVSGSQLSIWENDEIRPFATTPDGQPIIGAAAISDLGTVLMVSYRSELMLSADGDVLFDVADAIGDPSRPRDLRLSPDGVLAVYEGAEYPNYSALLIPQGTRTFASPLGSLTSTLADGRRVTAASSVTLGFGVFGSSAADLDGGGIALDTGPSAVYSSAVYADSRDGRSYVVALVGGELVWYTQVPGGGGSFDAGRRLNHGGGSPIREMAVFTSADGRIQIALHTYDNELLLVYQLNNVGRPPEDPANWASANLSTEHLAPQGLATPEFVGPLTSYITGWDGMNIAGLDADGSVHTVWWAPGITLWRTDNLTAIARTGALVGNLAVYTTAWDGINIAGTDAQGAARVIWWVPSFGGSWAANVFNEDAPAFVPGSLTAYVTAWNGLNVAGLTADGEINTLWWTPSTNVWTSQKIKPFGQPALRFSGPLTSVVDTAIGSMNLGAVTNDADHRFTRLLWTPEVPRWSAQVI